MIQGLRLRAVLGTALSTTALWATLTGCVTQGTYDELMAERDQIQASRDALQSQLDETSAALAASQEEIAATKGTYDQLVSSLQAEVASGQVEIQQIVDGIRLNVSDELLFSSGSAELEPKGTDLLGRVAQQIKGDNSVVSVEGNTDNVAITGRLKERYPTNWELAGARAAIVVRVLAENGVAPERMRAVSRGPFDPVASNDTPEGRAKNRRTEIILRPLPR